MIHRHFRSGARCAGADHGDIALGHGVDLPIGTFQGRQDQRAALEALGVADRRHRDVDILPGAGEGRQAGGDHHGGDVLQLQRLPRRHVDAHGRQHADDALHGKRRLRGLVAAAVKADDDTVADQLVGTHAGDRSDVLDALGLCRGGGEQRRGQPQRGNDPGSPGSHGDVLRMA